MFKNLPELKVLADQLDKRYDLENDNEQLKKTVDEMEGIITNLKNKVNSQPPLTTAQRDLKEAKLEIGKLKGLLELSEEQKRTDGLKTVYAVQQTKSE